MKNFGLFAIFTFLLLAGIFLFLRLGPLAEKPGMRGVPEPLATEDPKQHSPPSVPAGPPAGQSAAAAGQPGEAPPLPEATAGSPQSQSAPAAPLHRFPQAADVPSGMERSKIETLFGPPSMRTVSVDQGRQIETLVYLRTNPDAATFLLLRAGRVISATTTSY